MPSVCHVTMVSPARLYFSSMASEGFSTGSSVLIQGVGPLSMAHLMMARMIGAGTIIALDQKDYRLRKATAFGADHTLNMDATSEPERIELVRQWTDDRGVDVAIKCAGYPEAVPKALPMICRGGMYILEGVFVDMGDVLMNPHLIVSKELRLIGLSNHPFTAYKPSMELMLRYRDLVPFEDYLTHRFPLEQAQEAVDTVLGLECLKVVFEP